MSTYDLARLLVVPGFSGDVGWPDYLAPGAAGTIVMKGTGALSRGYYLNELPGDPQPFVSIDFEGGKVARNYELLGRPPSARDQAATMTPAQVRVLAAHTGGVLQSFGIDVNFAPVVDLDLGSPIVESRSYGSDPDQVVAYAGAFADGMRDAGVLPVIKHFPGHGSADGDSHLGSVTTETWEVLRARDVPVFTELLARPGEWMVMMGHLIVPGLSADPSLPTSLDPAAYRALRDETGFDGPVITDDLATMRAIVDLYTIPQAVVLAVAAGADMALIAESSQYEQAVVDLASWGDSDPDHRQQLINSARRAHTTMPCGRSS
jgi:beta-N-acetylhexosaminidase